MREKALDINGALAATKKIEYLYKETFAFRRNAETQLLKPLDKDNGFFDELLSSL